MTVAVFWNKTDYRALAYVSLINLMQELPPMQGDNAKAALQDALNGFLADLFALYVKTKNFHWHVRGPNFREFHLLFEEQATAIFALTDVVAERVRKNGGTTLTGLGAIADRTRITDQPDTSISAQAMIAELRADNIALVETIRAVKTAAAAAGDNATEGLADDWTDEAQLRVWFLSELLV